MKRKSIIFAILCVLMLVSGCSSQSTDDIYQMMENASSKSRSNSLFTLIEINDCADTLCKFGLSSEMITNCLR